MLEDLIIDHENRLEKAMLLSDLSTLDDLIADDLIFTNHLGQLMSKSEDLEGHRSGFIQIKNIRNSNRIIKIKGDVAIVTLVSEINGLFGDSESGVVLRFTRIWHQIECDKLQVIVAQSTLVS